MNEPDSKDQLDLGMLYRIVGYHLRRASNVVNNDFLQALAGTGIRPVPFAVLSVVSANPGVSQGIVARTLGIQRANMVTLINELLEKDLVRREASEDDRRAFQLYLTDQGEILFERYGAAIMEHEDALLTALTARQRATLIDLLSRITAREEEVD